MGSPVVDLVAVAVAWVDERDKLHVIPLLSDLENTIREHSFDIGYEIW